MVTNMKVRQSAYLPWNKTQENYDFESKIEEEGKHQ